MDIVVAKWLPFGLFARSGRWGSAVAALVMPMTLLLWPVASFWAMSLAVRRHEDAQWYSLVGKDF